MMISNQEEKEKEEATQEDEENTFKQKLVDWLKNNNMKLASVTNDVFFNVENVVTNDNSDMGIIDMGQNSYLWKLWVGTLEGYAQPKSEHK